MTTIYVVFHCSSPDFAFRSKSEAEDFLAERRREEGSVELPSWESDGRLSDWAIKAVRLA